MAWQLRERIVAFLVLCAFAGCSTTATISRVNGPAYEAHILASDTNFLRVRDNYGREFLVPREDVADIDHPGNVLYTIGLVLVAMSTAMIIGDLSHGDQSRQTEWSGMGLPGGA